MQLRVFRLRSSNNSKCSKAVRRRRTLLQAAFRGDVVPKGSAEDFQIRGSKEYGASLCAAGVGQGTWTGPGSLLAQRSLGEGLPGDDRRTNRLCWEQTGAIQPVEKHRSV